jgi:hypothetical protein
VVEDREDRGRHPRSLRGSVAFAKERAEQAEAARVAAEARANAERARADQAEARADEERDKGAAVERLLAQTVATHNRIAVEVEAREKDRARRAAGRLARLRAAWRGK